MAIAVLARAFRPTVDLDVAQSGVLLLGYAFAFVADSRISRSALRPPT